MPYLFDELTRSVAVGIIGLAHRSAFFVGSGVPDIKSLLQGIVHKLRLTLNIPQAKDGLPTVFCLWDNIVPGALFEKRRNRLVVNAHLVASHVILTDGVRIVRVLWLFARVVRPGYSIGVEGRSGGGAGIARR